MIGNLSSMENGEISGAKERSHNWWVFTSLPSNHFGFYANAPSCHFSILILQPQLKGSLV